MRDQIETIETSPGAASLMRRLLLLALVLSLAEALSNNNVLLGDRAQAAGAAWDDTFIVAGGEDLGFWTFWDPLVKVVDVLKVDALNGTFKPVSSPALRTPRTKLAAGAADGIILFAGGLYDVVVAALTHPPQ